MKRINPSGMKTASFLRYGNIKFIGQQIRRICVALVLILGVLSAHAAADSATLSWDANQPVPDGYRVYHRESGQAYDFSKWSCQVTGTTCTVENLAPNTTYHFVVRGYVGSDTSGNSEEVSHTTSAPPPSNYSITASAGPNGTITPSDEVSVPEGSDQVFRIAADNGYHISDVIVDDQSVGPVDRYEFTGIAANHSIEVLFEQSNRNPSADAGPDQTVAQAVEVTLDGSRSNDPDNGDSISGFQWRQISGTSVQIANASEARASFTTPNVSVGGQALEFELMVTDQSGASTTDQCIVNVTRDNKPPQADAGDPQQADEGETVVLNGSRSTDPESDPINFQWQQVLGPMVTLTQPQTANPQFTAPDVGKTDAILRFQLTVTDDKGLKHTDTCEVSVAWVNSPPKAKAGKTQTVTAGQLVYLDGTGSSDPDDNIDRYQWAQTSGVEVTLSDPSSSRPSFVAPQVDADGATLVFELTVFDTEPQSSTNVCMVMVQSDAGVDTDGDGYKDNNDAFPDDATEWIDTDTDGVGNNADNDDDGDGMPDSWETQYDLDPLDPADANQDPDGDGLTNLIECQGRTDPTNAETTTGWAPSVISPADGTTDISINGPTIEINANIGQDNDATIKQTLWQMISDDGQTVIFNAISDSHLSKIRIPRMILAPETTYICRVRCYDSNDQISDWSRTIGFVTEKIDNDTDSNGVPDDRQVTIGSNSQPTDAIPTNLSLTQKTGIVFVDMISNNENASLASAMYVDPVEIEEAPDGSLPTPFAMVANKVLTDPGEEVKLQIYFDSLNTPDTIRWIKYDAVNGWQDYTNKTRLEDNGRAMDVTVQDGGDGDADGVANGTIINMSGPATDTEQSGSTSTAGSSSGQCFIWSLSR